MLPLTLIFIWFELPATKASLPTEKSNSPPWLELPRRSVASCWFSWEIAEARFLISDSLSETGSYLDSTWALKIISMRSWVG